MDLVDGKVIQRALSTEQGNYRFKNVTPGKHKVRARKEGYAPRDQRRRPRLGDFDALAP